jgi:hypothetical protein
MSTFAIWRVDVQGRECERIDFRGGRKTYFANDNRMQAMRYVSPSEQKLRAAIDAEVEKEKALNETS